MAEVAAAADVSQGLAYRYFAGKDELFRALVEEALGSGERSDVWDMPGSPGTRLRRLIASVLWFRLEHPEFSQLIEHVMSDAATPSDLLERCRRRGMSLVTTVRQLIVEGQATGEVAPDDPEMLVIAIMASLEGLSNAALRHPECRAHFPDADVVMRILEVRPTQC